MSEENKILSVWDKNYQEAKAFLKKYGHSDRLKRLAAIGFKITATDTIWDKHSGPLRLSLKNMDTSRIIMTMW